MARQPNFLGRIAGAALLVLVLSAGRGGGSTMPNRLSAQAGPMEAASTPVAHDPATVAAARRSETTSSTTTTVPPYASPLLPADGLVPDPLDGQVLAGLVPRAQITQTVAYGPNPAHLIDLYLPDGPGPHPVIVWLHAGGWIAGTRADIPEVVFDKFADGWAIASVEYRLAPSVRFPVPIQDAERAVRYVKANAATLGVDPDTVVVAGASAGGHLAAMVASSAGAFAPDDLDDAARAVSPDVAGLGVLVGPVDLRAMIAAGGWGPGMVAQFLDCEKPKSRRPVCSDLALHVANPAVWAGHAVDEGRALPPAFLAYGHHDTLIVPEPNGARLFEAWRGGGPIWFDYVDNQGHNLDVNGLNDAALDEFLSALRAGTL